MRTLIQLLYFNTLRGFTWRWFAVPFVFGLAGRLRASDIEFDYVNQIPRNVNIWDVPATMMLSGLYVSWLFVLGFMILVGDSYIRDREQQTMSLTLSRVQSRSIWWIGKIGAVGILAVCFVTIAFLFTLIGAAFHVPISLADSPAASISTNSQSFVPRLYSVPMPIFVVMIGIYSACNLWLVGSIILTISLLHQKPYVPFVVTALWILLGLSFTEVAPINQLDAAYIVSYIKFFSPRLPISPFAYTVSSIIALVVVLLVGCWRMQRLDL